MVAQCFSSHNLDYLLKRAELMQYCGWKVVRPIYVDWFWRGYSIMLRPETEAEALDRKSLAFDRTTCDQKS